MKLVNFTTNPNSITSQKSEAWSTVHSIDLHTFALIKFSQIFNEVMMEFQDFDTPSALMMLFQSK